MEKRRIIFFILILLIHAISAQSITGEVITGKATSQTTNVSITVSGGSAALSLSSPRNGTYLTNLSLLLNYSVSGEDSVWYNLDNGNNISLPGSTYLNLSEGGHLINLYANNSIGEVTNRNISFSCNATKFIIYYEKYKGSTKGNSTDFYYYTFEELQGFGSIILDNNEFGRIYYNHSINITNINGSILDLDSYTNISWNRIYLDSAYLGNFNSYATVILRNLSFSNPRVLRDGSACISAICTEYSYLNSIFTFGVNYFSVYSSDETPIDAPSEEGGGGGGGGGGGIIPTIIGTREIVRYIDIDNVRIEVKLDSGKETSRFFTITNYENNYVNISLKNLFKKGVLINESSFVLEPGGKRIIRVDFKAEKSMLPDVYINKIQVMIEEIVNEEITISFEIGSENPLFDVKLEIPERYRVVYPGNELFANIEIYNLGYIGKADAEMDILIKDKDGNIFYNKIEPLAIETQASFLRIINLPLDIKSGDYSLYVRILYGKEVASSSFLFEVRNKKVTILNYTIIAGIVFAIIIVLFILLRIRHKRDNLRDLSGIIIKLYDENGNS